MRIVPSVAEVGAWAAGVLAAGVRSAAPRWEHAATAGTTSAAEHQPRNPRRLIAGRREGPPTARHPRSGRLLSSLDIFDPQCPRARRTPPPIIKDFLNY